MVQKYLATFLSPESSKAHVLIRNTSYIPLPVSTHSVNPWTHFEDTPEPFPALPIMIATAEFCPQRRSK